MKKIFLFAMLVIGLSFASNAQSFATLKLAAGDTLVAASGLDTAYKIIPVTAGYSSLAVKVKATKQSGTVSLKAYLYGGDGTHFNLTDSSAAFTDVTTNVVWFTKNPAPYSHYKVEIRPATIAATTQGVLLTVSYLVKRHD